LDAGDLLFKKLQVPPAEGEIQRLHEKAHLILKSLDLMGYHAIGIGDDDLSLGKEFLVDLSKKFNITFLSSNLIDEDSGKSLFQRYIIKEVNGLRLGIFSLLSQDVFLGPSDLRKKGVIFRDPIETALEMVKELEPQTDLIILLSHLSYQKDIELAQKIPGIPIIIGGHTGIHLSNPHVIKNTIVLQTSSKGMYAQKLNLTFLNKEATFYNITTKRSLENNLSRLQHQLTSVNAPQAEKTQWQRSKENIEKALQQLEEKNYFSHTTLPLTEAIKDHPDIKKMVDGYKSKFPEKKDPSLHDSRGAYKPKSP